MLAFGRRFDSPIVQLTDYTCCAPQHAPQAEEEASGNTIVLLRQGVFEKHFGRRRVTADLNQSVFFTKGSTFRVSHPTHCGDSGTVLSFSSKTLVELIGQHDPGVEARIDHPFPFDAGPSGPDVFAKHRALLALCASQTSRAERLTIETAALELGDAVLRGAFARSAVRAVGKRPETERAHNQLVENAKAYLASRLGESVSLAEVAQGVQSSPFHLSRVFRVRTGLPMHRYLLTLRLRTALERIVGGAEDLSALGLELGFSSHSHLTDAFRREFGVAPTRLRRAAAQRALRATHDLNRQRIYDVVPDQHPSPAVECETGKNMEAPGRQAQ